MRFSMLLGAALIIGLGAPAIAAPPPVPERARANYEAIMRGEKGFFDLSPAEQREIAALDKQVRAQPLDTRDSAERCRDEEYARFGGQPSDLDKRAIDTKCRP